MTKCQVGKRLAMELWFGGVRAASFKCEQNKRDEEVRGMRGSKREGKWEWLQKGDPRMWRLSFCLSLGSKGAGLLRMPEKRPPIFFSRLASHWFLRPFDQRIFPVSGMAHYCLNNLLFPLKALGWCFKHHVLPTLDSTIPLMLTQD